MSSCGCHSKPAEAERRVLRIALFLNTAMFIIGLVAGFVAQSTSLIADALDMLADASAYTIALTAVGRSARFKAGAASVSGGVLLVLGLGVLIDVARRVLFGSAQKAWS